MGIGQERNAPGNSPATHRHDCESRAFIFRQSPKRACNTMHEMNPDFTRVGALLGNPGRSAILNALLKGDCRSATELARAARVAPSTASEHLAALQAGGLVQVELRGRHRFYSISKPEVGEALEALARICPPTPVRSLHQFVARHNLAVARTCYDHLAGKLGVALHDALTGQRWIGGYHREYVLTRVGTRALLELGVDLESARTSRRAFARPCLDWTEQRYHLAGALGAAITSAMFDRGWLRRNEESERSVELTTAGRSGLALMRVDVPPFLDLSC